MYFYQKKPDLSSTEKYKTVKRLIEEERERRGIKKEDLGYGTKREPSCIAYGANHNFVEFQLMYNKEECSETWGMMRTSQTELDMAYEYLVFGKRFSGE